MGRTKRKRIRRKSNSFVTSLDADSSIISLKRWMKAYDWQNSKSLKLSLFKNTGRGLTSRKNTSKFDTLIEVPYELMITFTSVENSFLNNALLSSLPTKLKMQDLLSMYLLFEKHKGHKSEWKTYINSLPDTLPPLPWLCFQEEIAQIPEDLYSAIQDRLSGFKSSWQRSKESIDPRWKCDCCGTPGHCVLTLNTFTWAYVMVNTRAVYVDPDKVRTLSRCSANNLSYVLSDDPCMALCPYLDMFNHSSKAATTASLEKIDKNWVYKLNTLTEYKKHEEIFISYGSHDNVKLLCEYGFFIPDEELDAISFNFIELLSYAKFSLNERQYKFIHKKHLDCKMTVGSCGPSFNLKAILFVALNCDLLDWCPYVFSESYSEEDLAKMHVIIKQLIYFKIDKCSIELYRLNKCCVTASEPFKNVIDYMNYRLTFMKRTLNLYGK